MPLDRRSFLAVTGRAGLAATLFPGALYALAATPGEAEPKLKPVTPEMLDAAAALAGVPIAPEQRALMLDALGEQREAYGRSARLRCRTVWRLRSSSILCHQAPL